MHLRLWSSSSALVLWAACLTPAFVSAQWVVRSESAPLSLANGAVHFKKELTGPAKVDVSVVVFDTTKVRLEVLAQASKQNALPMDRWMKEEKAIAACNGGYFDPTAFVPAGLQVERGQKVTGKYVPFGEWGGGFGVRAGQAGIHTETEILAGGDFEAFVQCSPVLVDGARRFVASGEDERARRTFVAHDGRSKWAIGVCSSIGLRALADLLATRSMEVLGFTVHRALNLDGGPSTALWCRDEKGAVIYVKEGWAVKNVLVVVPLPAARKTED